MTPGEELFLDLHKANVEILAQHPDENVLALMDRAAIAGFKVGTNQVTASILGELHIMQARIK